MWGDKKKWFCEQCFEVNVWDCPFCEFCLSKQENAADYSQLFVKKRLFNPILNVFLKIEPFEE